MAKLYVTTNDYKMEVLKNTKKLHDYRFIDINEFINKILGKVSDNAIYYIYNNYNKIINDNNDFKITIPYIFNLLEYLIYIEINKIYTDKKLKELQAIKNILIKESLYYYDDLFIEYLKSNEITFYNLILNKKNQFLLNKLDTLNIKYNIINPKMIEKEYNLNILADEEEELTFIFNDIISKLKVGIKPSQIYLVNVNSQYNSLLKRMSYFYKVDINLKNESSLISKNELNDFLRDLDFNNIKIKDEELKKAIIDLINKYDLVNINDKNYLKDFFIYNLRQKKYHNINYLEAINISDLFNYFNDSDYIYLLNFNIDMPGFIKDDFLNPNIRKELNLISLEKENDNIYDYTINRLSNINNLTITFPKTYAGDKNFSSILNNNIKFKEIIINNELGKNKLNDIVHLTYMLDDFRNYGIKYKELEHYNLSDLNYLNYNNEFKTFKIDYNKPIKTSYSSMKYYFECAFHYYLDNVLNLKIYEETLAQKMGKFAHKILEDSYKLDFDFEHEYENLINEMTPKEQFYASRFKIIVQRLLEFNQKYEEEMKLDKTLREEKFNIIHNFLSITGVVDKIKYYEDGNKIYLAIYDYKTGSDKVSLDNLEYGFNMQLVIYLYALKNGDLFKNKEIIILGLYLQKVTLDSLKLKEDKIYEPFRLEGYTTSNLNDISLIEPNFVKSNYIKGLKITKTGNFDSRSKTFSSMDAENILNMMDNNLNSLEKAYEENDFKINPKKFKNEEGKIIKGDVCTFCPYRNICYKEFKDITILDNKPFIKEGETDEMDS